MLCPGYKKVRDLGEGGFGVVYLTEREKDKKASA
jgi:serine/threonine protein kinase